MPPETTARETKAEQKQKAKQATEVESFKRNEFLFLENDFERGGVWLIKTCSHENLQKQKYLLRGSVFNSQKSPRKQFGWKTSKGHFVCEFFWYPNQKSILLLKKGTPKKHHWTQVCTTQNLSSLENVSHFAMEKMRNAWLVNLKRIHVTSTQPFAKYFLFFQDDLTYVITSKEREKEGIRSVQSSNRKKMFQKKEKMYK